MRAATASWQRAELVQHSFDQAAASRPFERKRISEGYSDLLAKGVSQNTPRPVQSRFTVGGRMPRTDAAGQGTRTEDHNLLAKVWKAASDKAREFVA